MYFTFKGFVITYFYVPLQKISDMNELNKTLKEEAINLGLCKQWTNMWNKNFSEQELINLFFEGIDFCISNRWPSAKFIKENFSVDTLRQNNVLVDDKWSLINPVYAALIGNSECTIRYNGRVSGRVYVMEGVSVKILANNRSFVMVHSFGKTNIECKASDSATIKIIHHWMKSEVKKNGFVTELEELDYLRC